MTPPDLKSFLSPFVDAIAESVASKIGPRDPERLISMRHATAAAGVPVRSIRAAISGGGLPFYKIGREHFVKASDVNAWVETCRVVVEPEKKGLKKAEPRDEYERALLRSVKGGKR